MNTPDRHGSAYTVPDLNSSAPGAAPSDLAAGEADPEPSIRPSIEDAGNAAAAAERMQARLDAIPAALDGKGSVEFQIDMHVTDLFDVLASRALDEKGAGGRGYQLVRQVRDATTNMLRRSPSSTTVASSLAGGEDAQRQARASGESRDSGGPPVGGPPVGGPGAAAAGISLTEVLDSLQYVVDYRLKGRQQPHLDAGLMGRLCDALLLVMALTQGSFLHRRLSDDARTAYFLFGQFIEEVGEFQHCVGQKPVADLRRALKLHKRTSDGGGEDERLALATIIRLTLACLPPGNDWRDLVDEHEQRALAPVVEKYTKIIDDDTASYHMPVTGGAVFPPPSLYFDRTVEKLVAMYRTDVASGLAPEQVEERRAFYGRNELPRPARRPWWKIVWVQLTDLMVLMLGAAIIATAIDGEWKSSIVLGVVVVLNTVVGAWQEIKASRTLSALENLGTTTAQVIRGGTLEAIDAAELVPGDLVELNEGDAVPADLRLVSCAQLEIVESVLTGESVGVIKDPRAIKERTRQLPLGDCRGNAFMSTMVSHGRGRGIVTRVGAKSEIGKISAAISRSASTVRKTPIQRKLTRLGLWLVLLALALCATIVVSGVAWGRKFVPIFITGISLAVSVIPEGLVAVTTVTMALGVRRMARRNALVRTLPAVETLGGVTVICSDKTGTLTEGKMGMCELVDAGGMLFEVTRPTSRDPNEGEISFRGHVGGAGDAHAVHDAPKHSTAAADMSLVTCSLCNNAEIFYDGDAGQWSSLGDATEVAMTLAAQKAGLFKSDLVAAGPDGGAAPGSATSSPGEDARPLIKLVENAFDSDRKRMSVVFEVRGAGAAPPGKRRLVTVVKGAPEEILSVCTHQIGGGSPGFVRRPAAAADDDDDGDRGNGRGCRPAHEIAASVTACLDGSSGAGVVPLTRELTNAAGQACEGMASRGLRVLGMAAKVSLIGSDEPVSEEALGLAWAECGLVFVGLAGLIDPPRTGIVDSVRRCHTAGIKVVMITGDHIGTATAIAESIGIIRPDQAATQRAISGAELDLLSDEATALLDPFPSVFARVSPENKIKIVRALQQSGHIVAMTGDGVNDAAAVKGADIGVAMGLGGTDITKQAADMVLMDDDFTTIVVAVEEGRRIYDNIFKFIMYLLSCNTAEIMLFLIASVLNLDLPFTTIMILWANIIADIPPALSLGMDPPEHDIMDRPPRNPRRGMLTRGTTLVLVIQAFFMAATTFAVFIVAVLTPFGLIVLPGYDSRAPDPYVPSIFRQGNPETNANDNKSPHIAGARSVAFGVLTVLQLNQAFLSRSLDASVFTTGLRANKWMVWCVLLSFVLYVIGTYVPGLNSWLELRPLSWPAWLVILGAVLLQYVFSELTKLALRTIARRRRQRASCQQH